MLDLAQATGAFLMALCATLLSMTSGGAAAFVLQLRATAFSCTHHSQNLTTVLSTDFRGKPRVGLHGSVGNEIPVRSGDVDELQSGLSLRGTRAVQRSAAQVDDYKPGVLASSSMYAQRLQAIFPFAEC